MIFSRGTRSSNYHRVASTIHCLAACYSQSIDPFLFRYAAVTVDHSEDLPCSGRFLLHQGIQRRLRITLCHESGAELIWKNVREVLIGRLAVVEVSS